jgi:hypothetical protein
MDRIKSLIGELTDVFLSLAALAIVAAVLVGANVPFLGNVPANITGIITGLADKGLVGLIALGVILWLFSNRRAP